MNFQMNDRYKFLIAGGSNTAITYVVYVALVSAELHYNTALAIVYPLGIALGFWINRKWTFADKESPKTNAAKANTKATQLFKYVAVYGLIFLINLTCLNSLVLLLEVNPILAQLVALTVSTVCSYFLQKTWVFKS